jgi:hypothetical protein
MLSHAIGESASVYSPPWQGGVAARIKDFQKCVQTGRLVTTRSIHSDARVAHRFGFESIKERFAAFHKVASQYFQPPRLRLLSEAEHSLEGAATPPCEGGEYYADARSDSFLSSLLET